MKREAVSELRKKYKMSVSRACRLVTLNRASFDYKPVPDKDEALKKRMKEVCERYRRYGRPRIHWRLKKENLVVNEKKTRRIYEELGLQIKKRKGKKKGNVVRLPIPKPTSPNQVWSIDFIYDRLAIGRTLKVLNIVDDFTKVAVGQFPASTITGHQLVRIFESLETLPRWVRCDNGTEFWSRAFQSWAEGRFEFDFIDPGKPQQNGFIESFNGKFRDECLNLHEFYSIDHAREVIKEWRREYNEERPHSAIGMMPPKEFEMQCLLGYKNKDTGFKLMTS